MYHILFKYSDFEYSTQIFLKLIVCFMHKNFQSGTLIFEKIFISVLPNTSLGKNFIAMWKKSCNYLPLLRSHWISHLQSYIEGKKFIGWILPLRHRQYLHWHFVGRKLQYVCCYLIFHSSKINTLLFDKKISCSNYVMVKLMGQITATRSEISTGNARRIFAMEKCTTKSWYSQSLKHFIILEFMINSIENWNQTAT